MIRRGRVVSKPVRTRLCIKFARMAASMRGMVRRVSIGWRGVGGASLGFGDGNGFVEGVGEGLDGRFVRCGFSSGGAWALS